MNVFPARPGPKTAAQQTPDYVCAVALSEALALYDLPRPTTPRDDVQALVRELLRRPRVLSREEEQRLARHLPDVGVKQALLLANRGLAFLIANDFRRPGVDYDDLVAECTLGCMRALADFSLDRDCRVSTYMGVWARAFAQRYLQRLDKDHRPPCAHAEMETLPDGRRRRPRASALPLDAPTNDSVPNGLTLQDVIPDDGEDPLEALSRAREAGELRAELARAVSEEENEENARAVVEARLLADEPVTLSTMGRRISRSREGARLLENRLVERVRWERA